MQGNEQRPPSVGGEGGWGVVFWFSRVGIINSRVKLRDDGVQPGALKLSPVVVHPILSLLLTPPKSKGPPLALLLSSKNEPKAVMCVRVVKFPLSLA